MKQEKVLKKNWIQSVSNESSPVHGFVIEYRKFFFLLPNKQAKGIELAKHLNNQRDKKVDWNFFGEPTASGRYRENKLNSDF